MNAKKCKVLRRMARIEMTGYPEVVYEDQTVHPHKVKDLTGQERLVPITDPIRLGLCVRKYYHFLKMTVSDMSKRGQIIQSYNI